MPFTAFSEKRMGAAGIQRMDILIEKVKDLGVKLYVCKVCTKISKLD